MNLSRRDLLATTAMAGLAGLLSPLVPPRSRASAATHAPQALGVERRVIEVRGRPADVFGLLLPDGTHGLHTEVGHRFRVRLGNRSGEETLIHWHGLRPPWRQDGVPSLSQPALPPGQSYDYDFPLTLPGTNWMHSHHGLQEQRLMAAPLIIRDPAEAAADVQEVVVMLHDFTFRNPAEILAGLRGGDHGDGQGPQPADAHDGRGAPERGDGGHGAMDHGQAAAPADGHDAHGGAAAAGAAHLHDVEHDAYLFNDRTLDDPTVFRVERGGRVRLRLINAAAATNFWIDLGSLRGRLAAVDGVPVEHVPGSRFELAIAQRLDILIDLPRERGVWPVFAVREGDAKRTGFVLATKGGHIARLSPSAHRKAEAVGLGLERRLRTGRPLPPRPADRRHTVTLGESPGYVWTMNGAVHGAHVPLEVREGERVEITFADRTTMAHPMHLHGHHFQVVGIGGTRLEGAVRDTVLVPASGRVTIAFDADNPGKWALHCHHLYHMAGGMMTTVEYGS